jgi:class 3 adenylate cyclase
MFDHSISAKRCPSCAGEVTEGARFCPSCGVRLETQAPPPQRRDELRPVTVLFADIVGSTGVGERLTPDEVKVLVGDCVSRMSAAVEEYGGTVQAYMGDGICAYFGVPRAREDDAERAARAALKILEFVASTRNDIALSWGVEDFDVRIGINSGWAAVGLVGSAEPETVAVGDTTNVAARLEAAAEPGTVLVGATTAKRLKNRFVLEPAGDIRVRGRDGSVEAAVLAGPRERDQWSPRTRLVGRESEVAQFEELLHELHLGRGRILILTGEPGIGKTRLLAELRAMAGDDVTWLEGHCLSYQGLPYSPFTELLRTWVGIAEGETEIAARTKARARLGALFGEAKADAVARLGRLLGLPDESAAHERASRSTTARSAELHDAYRNSLVALAQQRPVVVALEDVQWLDASSRALAEDILGLTDHEPLLVVATLRPDGQSNGSQLRLRALAEYAYRTVELALGPLTDSAAETLLERLMPTLDHETRAELVEQAEGNPLYLEELANALVEMGIVDRRRTWTVAVGGPRPLPTTLESLLLARIDLLPDAARHLAQAAAVIGRTFQLRVLERVVETESLEADLAALLRMQVVHEFRRYPEREYRFKHGLVQEAVLSTLPAVRRKSLYARVAAAVEELSPDQLERLAHYHAQSNRPARALEFLEEAGARAEALSAPLEARALYERAARVAEAANDAAAEARIAAALARLDELPAEQSPEDAAR